MRWKNMEFIWFGENGRENGGEKVEFNPNSNRALGIRKEPIRPEGGWSHGVTPRRVVMATSSASKDPTMAIVYRRVADTRRKLTHTIRSPSWLLKHHNVAASGAESRKDLFLFFFCVVVILLSAVPWLDSIGRLFISFLPASFLLRPSDLCCQ